MKERCEKPSPNQENELPLNVAWVMILRQRDSGVVEVLASPRSGSDELTFPGGKLELEETPLFAAQRELFEETGLYVDEEEIFMSAKHPVVFYSNNQLISAHPFFSFYSESMHIELKEPLKHRKWKWYSLHSLFQLMKQGALPHISPEWFEIGIESFFVAQLPDEEPLPAYFLEQCRNIRIEAEYQEFIIKAFS